MFIRAWLFGGHYLKSQDYVDGEAYDIEWLWLNFNYVCSLHEASEFHLVPFEASRQASWDYLDRACLILGREKGRPGRGPSQADLQNQIITQLGRPPPESYSIYMMTVANRDRTHERAVYVGKTNSTTNRFRAGHSAISKLHHSKYDGLLKQIYFGCVTAVNDDDNSFPVEWINPLNLRETILASVEYQLIYELQPELNDHGRNECLSSRPFRIVTQNIVSRFLDAQTIDPLTKL